MHKRLAGLAAIILMIAIGCGRMLVSDVSSLTDIEPVLPHSPTLRPETGRGVTVYVFDGGVSQEHRELAGRVRVGYSAYPNDPPLCNAHGTAVAGAVAGSLSGMAPEAEIVDIKMVDCSRLRGTVQGIINATVWVVKDAGRHPGRRAVANWSFIADTSGDIPALDSAAAMLQRANIVVVASAGNFDMDACRISPANSPGVIVVGASSVVADTAAKQPTYVRVPHTAYGPCIDFFAPGDSVRLPSLDAMNQPGYQSWAGTSMSTGFVSGAAALYLGSHPRARPEDVKAALYARAPLVLFDNRRADARFVTAAVFSLPRHHPTSTSP